MITILLKSDCYTVEEKMVLCKKAIDIYGQLDECHNWPIGMIFSYQLYTHLAILSIQACDLKESLVALEKAATLAIQTDRLPSDGFPSSLLLNRISYRYLSGTHSECLSLCEEIESESIFDPLRKTTKYKQIIEKLKNG